MTNFTHLRMHSSFSIKDGTLSPKQIVGLAEKDGQSAVAITDLGRMFSTINFYEAARGKGVKPIVGLDAYIERDITDPGVDLAEDNVNEPTRMLLLSKNIDGYRRMMELLSRAYLENQHGEIPYIKQSWLQEGVNNIIALSGDSRSGDIARELLDTSRDDKASKRAAFDKVNFYSDIFGKGNFFLEIQRYGQPNEYEFVQGMVTLSHYSNIPLVATHPVQFAKREDYYLHEIRTSLGHSQLVDDIRRKSGFTREQHFKTKDEMAELFKDLPIALENAHKISQACSLDIPLNDPKLPDFPTPEGVKLSDFFAQNSREGLEERMVKLFPNEKIREAKRQEYSDRLETEIRIINEMGFAGYFMIVSDFMKWSKENKVTVGPGRGSGAGSLVAYALKITNLDPIPYGLLFERFLNPERVSMPDFDIDFESGRREEVIRYVREKYNDLSGTYSVSQIATYGLLKAKAVLKDVGRSLQMNYNEVDGISKIIPNDPKITLAAMMDLSDEKTQKYLSKKEAFRARYDSSPAVKRLVDFALSLENVPKSVGKHAGGVVIAPGKLTDFAPLYVADNSDGMLTCQYDGAQIEKAGLVKFDFLALSNLTVIEKAVMNINKRPELKGNIFDIEDIPLDDKKVFENIFANGNAIGVFQFESDGMRGMLKSIKPDTFEDLIALVSLYRPGPMKLIPDYGRHKSGQPFEYLDKRLEPVLKETHGIFIYQEQVMKAAQVVAGYSLGGADLLRRAMGKKKKEEMDKQRSIFQEGAVKNGLTAQKATEIFDLMEDFANYGFNKSHAAAYSLVAYQTAYLKNYYPAEFYSAFLNVEGAEKSKLEKVELLVKDARKNGIALLPPDINIGNALFVPENGNIRYGIAGLKKVKEGILNVISEERELNGNFTGVFDFCRRLSDKKITKTIVEKLIQGGTFDSIEPNRAKLYNAIPDVEKFLKKLRSEAKKNRDNVVIAIENAELEEAWARGEKPLNDKGKPVKLRKLKEIKDVPDPEIKDVKEWSALEKLNNEKAAIGFYLSDHPYETYKEQLGGLDAAIDIKEVDTMEPDTGDSYLIAGVISNMKVIPTKKGSLMAFATIDDGKDSKDITLFSDAYENDGHKIQKGNFVAFEVNINKPRNEGESNGLIGQSVYTFDEIQYRLASGVHLALKQENLEGLVDVLNKHKGVLNVKIYHPDAKANRYTKATLSEDYGVSGTAECWRDLERFVGKGKMKITYAKEITFEKKSRYKPR